MKTKFDLFLIQHKKNWMSLIFLNPKMMQTKNSAKSKRKKSICSAKLRTMLINF